MGVCRVTGLKIVVECKGPGDTDHLKVSWQANQVQLRATCCTGVDGSS